MRVDGNALVRAQCLCGIRIHDVLHAWNCSVVLSITGFCLEGLIRLDGEWGPLRWDQKCIYRFNEQFIFYYFLHTEGACP